MSSSAAKLVSLSVGLVTGNVFGIYLSQNYQVPDMSHLWSHVLSRVEDYTKPGRDKDDRDK